MACAAIGKACEGTVCRGKSSGGCAASPSSPPLAWLLAALLAVPLALRRRARG